MNDELYQLEADNAELRGALQELLERMEEASRTADHQIPSYAYVNNEAACDMSTRLATIIHILSVTERAERALKGEK